MDDSLSMQLDMLQSVTFQTNISEFLIGNADTIFNDEFALLISKPDHVCNTKIYKSTQHNAFCCYFLN